MEWNYKDKGSARLQYMNLCKNQFVSRCELIRTIFKNVLVQSVLVIGGDGDGKTIGNSVTLPLCFERIIVCRSSCLSGDQIHFMLDPLLLLKDNIKLNWMVDDGRECKTLYFMIPYSA